jgi:hypothetical protein
MTLHRTRHTAAALAAVALAAASLPARALDYAWNGGGGAWEDPAKWSLLGVPGAGDTATISNTSTGAVLLTNSTSLDQLYLLGGRLGGTGTLSAGAFDFLGGQLGAAAAPGGSLQVSGSTTIGGAVQLGVGYGFTLALNGHTTWAPGNGILGVGDTGTLLLIGNGARFDDLGLLDANGSKSLGYYGGAVRNEGTYTRAGLGSTVATAFDNRGTLNVMSGSFAFATGNYNSSSSGSIFVNAGSTLYLGNVDLSGSLSNQGLAVLSGGTVRVAASASIDGDWLVNGHTGRATFEGPHSLRSLTLTDGWLAAPGTLTTQTLLFNGGTLGFAQAPAGGTLVVSGAATIDGTVINGVSYSHQLQLNGSTTWTAGNGRISIDRSYTQGGSSFAAAGLTIGSGATFTDEGAASAGGEKLLGYLGGPVLNNGTYVRRGLGTTFAGAFVNWGDLQVEAGTFSLGAGSQNIATMQVAAGAVLAASSGEFVLGGLVHGEGTLRPFNRSEAAALQITGVLDPGFAGTMTIDGSLKLTDGALLRIDMLGTASDRLTVVDSVTWDGTLALWGELSRNDGEALSFVIATYGQRLAGSTFDRITWNGQASTDFTLEYGEHTLTLHVSAVPEPGSWALLLGGLSVLRWRRSRRSPA